MTCPPSGTVKGAEYRIQSPPSIRYSVRLNPLPPSVAERAKGVPTGKGGPDGEIEVVGGLLSRTTRRVRTVSTFPRRSVDRYSIFLVPSIPVRLKGYVYGDQLGPSTLYSRKERPTAGAPESGPPSEMGVAVVTYKSVPWYFGAPTTMDVEGGALSSTRTMVRIASTCPRRAVGRESIALGPA